MMRAWTVPAGSDIGPVDKLMVRPDGLLNVVPSWKLKEFPLPILQLWGVRRGVYQFPTEELLEWLSTQIAGRKAIEICAGNGVLGRELGIPATDSYMQAGPAVAAYYMSLGQHPITPPLDVERFDANKAVDHYQPDVVIGSWVTQLWREGDVEGSVGGVDETAIIGVADYIHIGNAGPHGHKRIRNKTYTRYRFDWLVSKAREPSLNIIDVWERPPSTPQLGTLI